MTCEPETTHDNADMVLDGVRISDDTLCVDIWYPALESSRVKAVQVGLMDVRAADDIRISYDHGRDGWVVMQASAFSWDADDDVRDPDWQEVAFVKAWGREKPKS